MFELSQTRILNRREHAEEETKKKVSAFEDRLNEYQKEVDSFRKKEVSISASNLPEKYPGEYNWLQNIKLIHVHNNQQTLVFLDHERR